MRKSKKEMLIAGLLALAAMTTGCTAQTRPAAKPTMQAAQQQTAQPATAEPEESPTPEPEEEKGPLLLEVDGKTIGDGALETNGELMLPLEATGEALGWKVQAKETAEETQTRHEITLEKESSRITVSWQVSDNTIRQISWQKDGLLVPVDTRIEMAGETVCVPAAFFEEAMGAKVVKKEKTVEVSSPEPMETPQTNQ